MPYICVSMKRIAFLLFSLFSFLVWNVPAQEVEPVWKDIVYKTVDGRAMTLDIYMPPPAVSTRPCPVIVYIHGGSWVTGSKEAFVIPYMQAVLDSVLDEGYAVVSIGYLLADTLSGEASFPRAIVDCKDAVRWVRGTRLRLLASRPTRIRTVGLLGRRTSLVAGCLYARHAFPAAILSCRATLRRSIM